MKKSFLDLLQKLGLKKKPKPQWTQSDLDYITNDIDVTVRLWGGEERDGESFFLKKGILLPEAVVVSPKPAIVICKHCFRLIELSDIGGHVHAEGANRGKMRCDPQDSMLVYGYNAEPVGSDCTQLCQGA